MANTIQNIYKWLFDVPATVKAERPLIKYTSWGDFWNIDNGADIADTPSGWLQAVTHNVWAANCVKARASAIAQTDLKLWRGAGDDRIEIESHPALDLLKRINPNFDQRSFMRQVERQLSIHGRCVVQKVAGLFGVGELYILPCDKIEVVSSDTQLIAGYRWLPTREIIPAEKIIDFWYPSDRGNATAQSPTQTALNAINRYNKADIAQEAIDTRGGQGGGIVTYDATVLPIDQQRMSQMWDVKRRNPQNAGLDLHMPAGTDYKTGVLTAQQQQREERMYRLAKEICAAYNVPPAIAGDYSDASVLANADAQTRAFWELFAIDELQMIAEVLTNQLLPAFKNTNEMYFEHDLTNVIALHESQDAIAARAINLMRGGVIVQNEAREMIGLDAIELQPVEINEIPNADAGAAKSRRVYYR